MLLLESLWGGSLHVCHSAGLRPLSSVRAQKPTWTLLQAGQAALKGPQSEAS